jgi:hypothetical protein
MTLEDREETMRLLHSLFICAYLSPTTPLVKTRRMGSQIFTGSRSDTRQVPVDSGHRRCDIAPSR